LASPKPKRLDLTSSSTKYIKDLPLPGQRKGAAAAKVGNKAKFLATNNRLTNDTTRSMPSSPNLSGVGSPSLGPTSVPLSQQQAEQAKATRKPVVHLLALSPMTEIELKMKIADASNNDIKQALQKVGDLNQNSRKWELRKNFYKELDVWRYKYDSEEDRQRAIDNAVRLYDKMRLGVSEPEWDRLLPKEERGTGKCLSKLQAQIAQGPVAKAPKINVQKAEDSGRDTPAGAEEDDDATLGNKNLSKVKGESMTRSLSQPPTTKSKKVSEKEAQAKRLLSKNPAKPKPKPASTKKEKQAQKTAGRVLSSQFVSDSDEEEDDYMSVPKAATKPSTTTKRSREDDGETSDSSIPLSKRVKKDTTNHQISDASHSSRTTNTASYSSSSSKTKGNSPQLSSPLASSPPTNASEFENSSGHSSSSASPAHSSIKVSRSPIHKRHQKSSSVASSVSSTTSNRSLKPEVMDLARKYRIFYPKYEALHREVASLGARRDSEKEQRLLDMHERLSVMKKDILAGIVEAH
jgi:RNA polymerase II elongation factor ELL